MLNGEMFMTKGCFKRCGMRLATLLVVVACVGTGMVRAQDDDAALAPKRLKDHDLPGLDAPVNLQSLDPWDVVQLIEFLAHRGGLNNIVIGQGVQGLTTKLKFSDVTVGDALEVVLSVNGLAYEVSAGIITIMLDAEYQERHGQSFYERKQVRVIELKYADPTRVASMLRPIKSAFGTIVPDPITGTLILIDTPEKIHEMRAVIEKADLSTVSRVLPTITRVFVLQYGEVETIHAEVSALLTKDAGSVRMDARTKTLIVTDLPHTMEKVENLVAYFDRRPRQVFIEAKIIEVALDDTFSLGINWEHLFSSLDPDFSIRTISQPGGPYSPSGSIAYNTVGADGDLSVVLQALKTVGETRILSNPQIAVMDGKDAMIEVVEDQPYKEVQLESGTTNVTGVTYLFKKVGVLLAVTPRINDEDFISISLKPEISSISQWYDGAPQEGTPVVRKAYAETTVMVKNGVTIIIGGMIKDRSDTNTRKIPLLGSIPLLGRFFRYDTVSKVNTETVVFLTPRIISGEQPFLRLKDMQKKPKPLRSVGASSKQLRPAR